MLNAMKKFSALATLALAASACGSNSDNTGWVTPQPGQVCSPWGYPYGCTSNGITPMTFQQSCSLNGGTFVRDVSNRDLCKYQGSLGFRQLGSTGPWTVDAYLKTHDRVSMTGKVSYNGDDSPTVQNPMVVLVGSHQFDFTAANQTVALQSEGNARISVGGSLGSGFLDFINYVILSNPKLQVTRCVDVSGISYPCP